MKDLFIRVVGLIFVGLVGIVLCANLLSIHKIYPITTAMIDKAPDATTRQGLIQDREKRNGEERMDKIMDGLILAADVALFVWLGSDLWRRGIQSMA